MLVAANILQPLINVFEVVIKFFHNNVGVGWGVSIVLLTLVVRAVLTPLTVKQYRSMQALQAHQPELKALQAKYKDDKQRLNQEIMKFYKENNVNPLGSCLPLVLQFPVFISLYYLLRKDLRGYICPHEEAVYAAHHGAGQTVACGAHGGASFLFIPDLTNKATGVVLIVMLGLYIGTQLFSSMMMASPAMDQTQRRLMMLMPLVFVIFFISFPAGVILYWITTNLWTIGQQFVVKRFVGPPPAAVAVAGAGGGGGGGPPGGGKGPDAPSRGKPATAGGGSGGVSKPSGQKKTSGGTAKPAPADAKPATTGAKAAAAGLLRRGGLEPAPEASGGRSSSRGGAPPPSPRKKKKRSGRRR